MTADPWMLNAYDLWGLAVERAQSQQSLVPVFGRRPDVSDRERGYIVIIPGSGWEQVSRGHGRVTSGSGRFHVACYGSTVDQAAFVLDVTKAAFRNWWPYPDRPRFGPIELDGADEVWHDKTVPTDNRWRFDLTYRLPDD